jgi:hypothetical protein
MGRIITEETRPERILLCQPRGCVMHRGVTGMNAGENNHDERGRRRQQTKEKKEKGGKKDKGRTRQKKKAENKLMSRVVGTFLCM